MSTRLQRLARLACVLVGTLVVQPAAHRDAVAAPPPVVAIESADFLLSGKASPPEDSDAWRPVTLPDDWRRLGPDFRGQGWYRMRFDVPAGTARPLAVYLRHTRSRQVEFFVNGALLGAAADLYGSAAQATGYPVLLAIPPALLRPGANVLHVRMVARVPMNPAAGLGRVTVGEIAAIRSISARDANMTSAAYRMFTAAMLAAGLIALFLWFARRADRVMLWFGIICLSWAVLNAISTFYFRDPEASVLLRQAVRQYVNYGLPVPAVVLCLRTVGLRWPRTEAVLWAYFAFLLTFPAWMPSSLLDWAWTWIRATGPLLCLGGACVVLARAPRPLTWSFWAEALAMVAMALAFSFDLAREAGWLPLDSHNLRPYHVPALLMAFGAAIFERHVATIWRAERTREELERRVAEKTLEIESYHAERQEALRQHALAVERQRIITDMHDGLGASLVGLLRYVQATGADPRIEQRVKEALQELRIAIDALEPVEGDLASVLGNLRYRLQPLIEPTGIRLDWSIAELPRVEHLEPSAVFAIQRIVLEAITNSIKHAGAHRVQLSARARIDGMLEIRIADDGRGFDAALPTAGLGLASMRTRAERMGAHLDVSSAPGAGTTVCLLLPGSLPAQPVGNQAVEGAIPDGHLAASADAA